MKRDEIAVEILKAMIAKKSTLTVSECHESLVATAVMYADLLLKELEESICEHVNVSFDQERNRMRCHDCGDEISMGDLK